MNSLSWLIYLASVSGSASSLFSFLAFMGAVFMVLGVILSILWTDGGFGSGDRERRIKGYEDLRASGKSMIPRGILMFAVCGVIAALLPGSNTIYAIAASEVGERVITDETVKGIAADSTKALQGWIKKQIEPEAKK
jgi:threonine/homoserine/homoserine lactone efflux protein